MPSTLRVTDARETQQAVAELLDGGRTAEIVGRASRRSYGRPLQTDALLDVSALDGITVYEPAELVLSARPGSPLSLIRTTLAEQRQHLAFEPPDFGRLWGQAPGCGTLGGCLSLGAGGPRRPSAGAPRDHFLGVKGVNGFAQAFAAGGRVVKNVTGFDLPKLLAGSLGTLAVMTEVTVKVMPAPPCTKTLLLHGLDDAQAVALMSDALSSPAAVSGAAHFPAALAGGLPGLQGASAAVTALRLEGLERSVNARLEHLRQRLAPAGSDGTALGDDASRQLWTDVADVAAFAGPSERPVWRLSIRASAAVELIRTVQESLECRYFFDWGGALLWMELPPEALAHQGLVREVCMRVGGTDAHATLVRANESVRANTSPLPPLVGPLAALTERIKAQFDPQRLFNRGRMYPGL
ncbi:MAG TPA: FAD-binding protein [Steroidobacteraceae bacterium]